MQKRLFGILTLLSIMLGISGCNSMDDKTTSLFIIYCIAAVFFFIPSIRFFLPGAQEKSMDYIVIFIRACGKYWLYNFINFNQLRDGTTRKPTCLSRVSISPTVHADDYLERNKHKI